MNQKNHKNRTLAAIIAAVTLSLLAVGLTSSLANTAHPPLTTAALLSDGVASDVNIYLYLEIDGNIIEGESAVASLDRENLIPVHSFTQEVHTPEDSSGSRTYKPIVITKSIDKTSPLLAKALTNNEKVDKAEFRFFRLSSSGAGSEEHFYTIVLEAGQIVSLTTYTEITDSGNAYHLEEVSISFQDITWTYEVGGASHRDSLRR